MQLLLVNDLIRQRRQVLTRLSQLVFFLAIAFALDRAGAWVLLQGLERYYGFSEPAQVLLIGHSHVVLGVDKVQLEKSLGHSVAKYARAGSSLRDRQVMVEHYMERNPGAVDVVVFGVDARLFTPEGLSSNSYKLFYPYMDDAVVGTFLKKAAPSFTDNLTKRISHLSRYNDVMLGLAIRGWLGNWKNYKHGTVNVAKIRKNIAYGKFRISRLDPRQVEIFRTTIADLRARNVKVILAYIPTIDLYNAAEPDAYAQAVGYFQAAASADPGVVFVDLNPAYASRHELFVDPVHMNRKGQKLVTRELADVTWQTLKRRCPQRKAASETASE